MSDKTDKTEFLIIGTHRQRDKIKTLFPIPLLNQHVMPAVSTGNLGVIFDDKLNFREHISQICRTCFYHIRDLRRGVFVDICLFLLQRLLQQH